MTADEQHDETPQAPAPAVIALEDKRYLGAGIRLSDPDENDYRELSFVIDPRHQFSFVLGPAMVEYLEERLVKKSDLVTGPEAVTAVARLPKPKEKN